MKKQRKQAIILELTLLTISFVILALLLLWNIQDRKKGAEECVSQFMDSYIQQDAKRCAELLIHNPSNPQEFSHAQSALSQTITYAITGSKMNRDSVTVYLEIENVDFEKAFTQLLSEDREEIVVEDIINFTIESARNTDYRKIYSCEATVYRFGEEDKISMTRTFSNALLGGISEFVSSLFTTEGGAS
ncbi:MAG TPA: hypothetical protein IAB55_06215 [Candidatus Merdivicinus faecavium]|nr:hypothetical protein [Candidatus Merdivicinus faecavium]